MVQTGCRPWNLSLVSVIILGLSNMFLTFLLLQCETWTSTSVPRDFEKKSIPTLYPLTIKKKDSAHAESQKLPDYIVEEDLGQQQSQVKSAAESGPVLSVDLKLGRWDSRRMFRSFDSVMVGADFSSSSERSKVCLATQSSVEKLYSLVQVMHHWSGPMSVALYAAGDEEFDALQKYLTYLRECYQREMARVSFSLIIPKGRPPRKQARAFRLSGRLNCAKPEATLSEFTNNISNEQVNWRTRNVYPQNHVRNLARKNCQTDYVFLTDVDIVPSYNMNMALDEFLRRDTCDKCAYVIPTYELDTRVHFPNNKTELVRLAKKSLARPFHQKVFIHNQYATNFTRWIEDVTPGHKGHENIKNGRVYVSHDVTNFEFLYEPFYVAKDTVVPHDERFMGYGYTRNTQVYEMYVAGYRFKVLSPLFTVHWGLQSRKNRPAWRERQNSANRKHFEIFKKEVFARHSREALKVVDSLK